MSAHTMLQPAPLESARFGLRVSRAVFDRVDDRELVREIIAARLDVAIIRLPTTASSSVQRLSRAGLHPIHADTLVCYTARLDQYEPQLLRNSDLQFERATAADAASLSELIEQTFAHYRSHYHANPRFPAPLILGGYKEWAEGYVNALEGRETWIARRDGTIIAFACCRASSDNEDCEGVLYGVHPEHAGGGLYGDLIRYTQTDFKQRGFRTMKVSTQIQNFAVQKVWAREGFVLTQAYDTFHVNALLDCGELLIDREIRFSKKDVERFAEVSGDRNDVHLDDEAARRAGFEQRISHGMLAGAEFSRIFGMQTPGPGTLFLRSELVFLHPIYAGRTYRLRVRFPDGVPLSGYAPAVGTIEDPEDTLCLVSYHDLLKRS